MGDAAKLPDAGGDLTRRLAEFVAGLRYEDLPGAVIERTRACVLDNLGGALLGNKLETAQRLSAVARETGSAQQAAIFGTPHRASVTDAALINSAAAHVFEFDDVHNRSSLHVASLVVPAALALAEGVVRISGRELITALAAGAEAGLRIGCGASGPLFQKGLHAHAVCGIFAAGLTAAKLLHLDARQAAHVMGHCGSQAAGLNAAQDGSNAKSLQSGRAAASGVYAALLARRGLTGIESVLETRSGFFPALAGDWDPAAVTSNLGARWEMLEIGFKAFPVNGAVGAAVEALDRIMRAQDLKADEIEEIVAGCSTRTFQHCGARYSPHGRHGAQMSLAYGLALMAVRRAVSARAFLGDRFDEPQLTRFADRVYEDETLVRLGDPRRPMQLGNLRRKFTDLAGLSLLAPGVEKVVECVDALEALDDCKALTDLLTVRGETMSSGARTAHAPA